MTSRRTILRAVAAVGALTGVRRVGAQQPAEIRLDGRVSGWVGRSPQAIAGETNPTLMLEPGRTYRVVWTNVDGAPHNFTLVNSSDDRLISTDIVDERGASQTVEFEATAAMARYFCEVHPSSMRGQVTVGGQETTAANETSPTAQPSPSVLDATTIVLGGLIPHWLGLAPGEIYRRENPTIRLQAGTEYDLVWINLDGAEHDFHVIDSTGDDVADTSSRDGIGEIHSTSFEATGELVEYYCAFHPESMRGVLETN